MLFQQNVCDSRVLWFVLGVPTGLQTRFIHWNTLLETLHLGGPIRVNQEEPSTLCCEQEAASETFDGAAS